ncbi:MAG: hypothetical protein RBS57_15280, partial [Desulforhabdus sp.]|nr:hypothetical protein [Desulforhabdus sp.]
MGKMIKLINPVKGIHCRIKLPGSKSITHRALLMAALAEGKSRIKNPLKAEDTLLTAGALQQLGVEIDWDDQAESILVAPPEKRWSQPQEAIFLGNSGTSMRLLLGLAATGSGKFVFDGTPRLRERPIGPVLDALEAVGVNYRCLNERGFPPVEIESSGLKGGEIWVDASQSSQFLSALLIASPCAQGEMRVGWQQPVASFPYVRLTLAMMEQFGIGYRWITSRQIAITAPQSYPPLDYQVEADCSSASYYWAAAAVTQGEVLTYPLSPESSQGDCRLLNVLQRMGCGIQWQEDGVSVKGEGRL